MGRETAGRSQLYVAVLLESQREDGRLGLRTPWIADMAGDAKFNYSMA